MKSISTGIIAASLGVGLLTLAPARIQAQPTSLSIALTATYQNPSPKVNANPNITVSSTLTEKFTSTTIIDAAVALGGSGTASQKGWSLIWDSGSGELGATNKADGGEFNDASSLLSINTEASGKGLFVTSGTSDTTDSPAPAQTLATTGYWNITYDDGAGNSFNVSGLVKMTVALAKQDAALDPQTATVSFSGTVSGFGTVLDSKGNTDNAVFTGTISGSGKGPQGS